MGLLIPNRSACLPRMTSGERRFALRLEDKLGSDYLCWYDVAVGPQQRHPDFVVLHPSLGFLILEVKDWKLETIVELSRDSAVLHTERGRVVENNPFKQARGYALEVVKLLERDPALIQPHDHPKAGKLIMPWGWGVVLANITRHQFEQAGLDTFIPSGNVICKDEMTESVDPDAFQKALADMYLMPFLCRLTEPQIDRVRWSLFPELRLPQQGSLFGAPAATSERPEDVPDIVRIMDLQQEQLARSLGDGHRVIHGVAGSGKTMILGYRCLALAQKYAKPILVLCFNKTLAARLEQIVQAHGIHDKVAVKHFHGWCAQQLDTYAVARPEPDTPHYFDALVQAVMDGVEHDAIPRAQYAAVLIDEGHDFKPEWLRLIVQMVDKETNSLLVLYDDAQKIYEESRQARKFSFASVGIQAQGRTTILRLLPELTRSARYRESLRTGAHRRNRERRGPCAPHCPGKRRSARTPARAHRMQGRPGGRPVHRRSHQGRPRRWRATERLRRTVPIEVDRQDHLRRIDEERRSVHRCIGRDEEAYLQRRTCREDHDDPLQQGTRI
jgi:hypothetical protein